MNEERADDVSKDVERIDELEFLARVVTQLPEPRKHSIRYHGYYVAGREGQTAGSGRGRGVHACGRE